MRSIRTAALLAAGTTLITSTVVLAASPASAVAGCPTADGASHCYARGAFGPLAGQGPVWMDAIGTDLEVDCLSVGNRSTDFADYEMWMTTNNNYDAYDFWVEEGMTAGTLYAAPGAPQGFVWYWADSRPNGGGYNEHYVRDASTGNYTNVSFYFVQGTGDWNVFLGGSQIGTSAGVGAYAGSAANGVEVTTRDTTIVGNSANWQYRQNNVWNWAPAAWQNTSGNLLSGWTNGPSVHAQTNSCSSHNLAPQSAPAPQAATPQRLSEIATQFAALAGDTHATNRRYVKTTRKAANALNGAQVAADGQSYLIQLDGKFTVPSAKTPKGQNAPTGTELSITVDAATGRVTDWGVSASSSGLEKLGAVSQLG
ncbi:hypothetical protein ACFW1A_31710 [Kitasatospora sp. NPDC058965]|uniref:hypothetical protein n=1 Tax=Kitasatospora sp. NPDC058965 TaxID=3346682 RepID=UPI0036A8BA62